MDSKKKLYLFSHAGGNSNFFSPLASLLRPEIYVFMHEYKGRGTRFDEQLSPNLQDMIEDAAKNILETYDLCSSISLLGYSLGSTICYYLYSYLKKNFNIDVDNVFFMANVPPYTEDVDKEMGKLPDEQFWQKLEKFGGIPDKFFEYQELMDLYLPILRSDVNNEKLFKKDTIDYIDANMIIIYSESDCRKHNIAAWDKCSVGCIKYYSFPGDHFFLKDKYKEVANIINNTL